jgi:rhodanese-related sulfurtransferase
MKHSPGFLAIVEDAKQRIREIDVAGYRALVEEDASVLLIDTREESEFAAGHAAGAMHLSKGIIERDIEQRVPDNGRKLVLYCGGGYRSALAADNLQRMGYRQVWSLAGGWRAWLEAGMPVEQ